MFGEAVCFKYTVWGFEEMDLNLLQLLKHFNFEKMTYCKCPYQKRNMPTNSSFRGEEIPDVFV